MRDGLLISSLFEPAPAQPATPQRTRPTPRRKPLAKQEAARPKIRTNQPLVRTPPEPAAQRTPSAQQTHGPRPALRQPVRSQPASVVQPEDARKLHQVALSLHAQPADDVTYRKHNLNFAAGNAQLIAAEHSRVQTAEAVTLLLLKPRATAHAGPGGSAIATPIAHAFVHEGSDVDIVFDPSAVAVAGPGGFAQAYSDLVINVLGQ